MKPQRIVTCMVLMMRHFMINHPLLEPMQTETLLQLA